MGFKESAIHLSRISQIAPISVYSVALRLGMAVPDEAKDLFNVLEICEMYGIIVQETDHVIFKTWGLATERAACDRCGQPWQSTHMLSTCDHGNCAEVVCNLCQITEDYEVSASSPD